MACSLFIQGCEPWDEPTEPRDPSNGMMIEDVPPPPLTLKNGVLHPKIFEMFECWTSDTQYPVVLEINLDAVEADSNQFDFQSISRDGDWFVYKKADSGFLRYKALKRDGRVYTFLYQSNGCGSLTLNYEVTCKIDCRTLSVDGRESDVKTLKVISFKLLPQPSK